MKLINLFKTKDYGTGEEVLYISTGDGYFPRFGSYPIQHGQLFKFTDSDDLWVWTGDMLRPMQESEGSIAYDYNGQRCAKLVNGVWLMNAGTIGLSNKGLEINSNPILQSAKIEIGKATESTFPALIGNVIVHIDPVAFVRENLKLLDEIVDAYLNPEDDSAKESGLFPDLDRLYKNGYYYDQSGRYYRASTESVYSFFPDYLKNLVHDGYYDDPVTSKRYHLLRP